jgi:TonB-dependent receptor
MRLNSVLLFLTLLSGAFVLVPGSASGQTGTVTGVVQDDLSGLILPGAQLEIEGSERRGVSDRTGRFIMTGVASGSRTLVVRYMGFAEQRQTVQVPAGGTVTVTFRLLPEAIALEGITATGQRDGQARALQQQRIAPNITNVVAADQIGRFPDANIGDAMKRIPGFAVMVDQGEARFGLIRGTEPRLNSITLNGERVPSAEGEVREVQLDLIPSDMVQSIEVNKAVTPDMDADAIGASVNIVTRQDPPGQRISATLGSGYNALADRGMALGSIVYGNRLADNRLGFMLSASGFNHHLGSDNIEAVWDQGDGDRAFIEEMDIRRYDVQRLRRSFSGSLDYDLSPVSSLSFRAMYNHRDDWENRYRLRYVLDEPDANGNVEGTIRRQTKGGGPDVKYTRLEDQRVLSFQGGGEHLLGERLSVDWSAGFARASEDRPDERYIEWQASDVPMSEDISNPGKPQFTPLSTGSVALSEFNFRRIEAQNSYTQEEDYTGRLDFTLPLRVAGDRNDLRFGARLRMKDKYRDNDFFRAVPQDGSLANLALSQNSDFTRSPYLAGNYQSGFFTNPSALGDFDFANAARFTMQDRPDEYAAANYEASESIYAGYMMWDRDFGNGFSLIAGVRVEQTGIDYSGFEFDEDTDAVTPTPTRSDDYTNVLPGLHLRYETTGGTVVRAAWTNTISRPNYYDLVPYRVISNDDLTLETGNPDLDPTTAMNFDLMVDRYLPGVGLVSAGAFYKDINSFIFTYSQRNAVDPVTGTTFNQITQPLNGSNADLFGLEVAFQRQLDFLPGMLSGLGLYTNYTFTESSIDGLNVDGRESEDLPLPGSAKHTTNFSLSYDYGRVGLRGSVNYASSFIDPGEIGDSAFFDRYYDNRTDVDLNGTFAVSDQFRIFFEANNLTNQPLRYYQGISTRMMQEEFYDRRFTVGMKYDF